MRRDLKIGMLIGVGVVICATVALSLWPGASVEDRVRQNMADAGGPGAVYEPPKPIVGKPGSLVIPERKPGETDESIIRPFVGDTKLRLTETPGKTVASGTTEPAKPKPTETIHVVAPDETLSKISQRYYGTSSQWQKILQANSAILKAPEKIKPGMRLVIPDAAAGSGAEKPKPTPKR
jgi:LysM repeat protein